MPKLILVAGCILFLIGIIPLLVRTKRCKGLQCWDISFIVCGFVVIIVSVALWLTGVDWEDLASWVGVNNANGAQVLATLFAGLVALVGIILVVRQLKMAERSLRLAARASLDEVRTRHNWELFQHRIVPGLPGLPPREGNEEYWNWRMVHLDHLSLLQTQLIAYKSGALNNEDIKAVKRWAFLILEELQRDRHNAISDLREKDKTPTAEPTTSQITGFDGTSPRLRAFLHISELHNWDMYPSSFVTWLLDECRFDSLDLSSKKV